MQLDIKAIIDSYGFRGFILLVLFAIISQIVKSNWFSKWWEKTSNNLIDLFIKKRDSKSITESDILNHDIFNYIDFWTNSKIPTFQFSSEYRTIIFKKYLTVFLKNYKQELTTFVNSRSYQEMNQSELWKSLLDLLNHIIFSYEKESMELGIPKIIIMKMKSKNNDTIALTIDLIESVSNSQFYQSDKNLLKMYSILNIILSVLESMISNSENICNNINGQLKGLTVEDNGRIIKE